MDQFLPDNMEGGDGEEGDNIQDTYKGYTGTHGLKSIRPNRAKYGRFWQIDPGN